jgi:hypothetical protein
MCWGLVVSLFVATGCGTVSPTTSISWLRGVSNNQKQQKEGPNPFRRNDLHGRGNAADDGGLSQHDPITQQLIRDELADATPAERENLLAKLQSLDPLLIEEILKVRRIRIEMEQEEHRLADVRSAPANEPYHGLGADFPGARQPGGVRPAADSRHESAFRPFGQDYGHSQSYADSSRAPGIDIPDYGAHSNPHSPGVGRSFDVMRAPGTQRQFADDSRRRADVDNADFSRSQGERPVISAHGKTTAPPVRQEFRGDGPTQSQYRVAMGSHSNAEVNPLQFTGIDTSSIRRQDGNGMLPAYQQPDATATQWSDALQRLIVAAEQQAYAAQTTWEQADQLPVGNNLDENARRQLIDVREQDFVEKQVHLRMLYLMSGQQARALERVPGIKAADQEFWTQVMWSLANYFDVEGIPNQEDRATQTITQLRSAIQRLQETAKLEIRNVDFCRNISSFGNYEAFADNVFTPGQAVMVYGEIQNFASERGRDGIYRTQLKSTIEIHKVTPQGSEIIETIPFDATTDLCRNHRRDYYHSYELQIPTKATSGSYALVLVVEDQISKRVATFSRNFTVK